MVRNTSICAVVPGNTRGLNLLDDEVQIFADLRLELGRELPSEIVRMDGPNTSHCVASATTSARPVSGGNATIPGDTEQRAVAKVRAVR